MNYEPQPLTILQSEVFKRAEATRTPTVFEQVDFPHITLEEILEAKPKSNEFLDLSSNGYDAWSIIDADLCIEKMKYLKTTHLHKNKIYYSTGDAKGFGKHRDMTDVLFIQLIGRTKWVVEDRDRGDLLETILDPFDAIYVPHGIFHTVINETPVRAGASLVVGGPE
jgi:ribosomal protein L16 Arg81 hydroxylase